MLNTLFDETFFKQSTEKLSQAAQITTDVYEEDPYVEKDPPY